MTLCKSTRSSVLYRRMALVALCILLAACNALDPYNEKFTAIAIGNSRASVIGILGEPDSVASVEWPLMKIEQLAWRSPLNGRVYTIVSILDRVAGKTVIQ